MKKAVFFSIAIASLWCFSPTEVQAQNQNKEYWKAKKEYNKKKAQYYKERNKERGKYYKEMRKAEKEYYKDRAKAQKKYYKAMSKYHVPAWGKPHQYDGRHHVYFKDYKTFYDPRRAGYVYMDGDNWVFSASIPKFLVNVDLGRAKIKVMNDVPLYQHPEKFYHRY